MSSNHHEDDVFKAKRKPKGPIKFKLQLNEEQKIAKATILENPITVLKGMAGSGKTLVAAQVGLDLLFRKEVDKVIITRPTVAKEDIGFLPGDIREKMDPWLAPIYHNLFMLYDQVKIEKEIELIQARDDKDKRAFVNGLLELDQEKRNLEQDKTLLRGEKNMAFLDSIIDLKKQLRAIEQDKTIEQIELAFQLTPLANNNEFSAGLVKVTSSRFQNNNNDNEYLVITIVIGLIAGIFYVLISNNIQSHRFSKKKIN